MSVESNSKSDSLSRGGGDLALRATNVSTCGFSLIHYNVCSLRDDSRLDMLLHELDAVNWDVVAINETKREDQIEHFQVNEKHMFYGAGGCKNRRGVGFLVHERLGECKFTPTDETLAVLKLVSDVGNLWICSVYIPDTTYSDEEVLAVYANLDRVVAQARSQHAKCVVAGDIG